MSYLVSFSYDGSLFYGYQKQPGKRTVQKELEDTLRKINGGNIVRVSSSGRTDRGVHALGQTATFDLRKDVECGKLKHSINSLLPDDIYVQSVSVVPNDFHARFNARGKEYFYVINMGEYNPIERNYVYQLGHRLDIISMERALKFLEGEHNFKAFSKSNDDISDYVRNISDTSIIFDKDDLNKIVISFVGNGFLRYMVRNMVGLLVEIGEGKRLPEDVIIILQSKDRTCAGVMAPACGLYLKRVFY